jgi:hypothetical protein
VAQGVSPEFKPQHREKRKNAGTTFKSLLSGTSQVFNEQIGNEWMRTKLDV